MKKMKKILCMLMAVVCLLGTIPASAAQANASTSVKQINTSISSANVKVGKTTVVKIRFVNNNGKGYDPTWTQYRLSFTTSNVCASYVGNGYVCIKGVKKGSCTMTIRPVGCTSPSKKVTFTVS